MSRFALDEQALHAIDEGLTTGETVVSMLGKHTTIPTYRADGGATIVLGGPADDADSVAAALRLLAQLCRGRFRSTVMIERRDDGTPAAREGNDAIGRLIVRLNITQLVAVGSGTRHVQAAAGLEGSWDGESMIVDSAQKAYAVIREDLRANDVVLVMGPFGDSAAGFVSDGGAVS